MRTRDVIKQINELLDSVSEHVSRWESEVSEDLEDFIENAEEKARSCCLKLDEMLRVLSEDHLADTENLKDIDANNVKILLDEFAKMEDLESYDMEMIRELQGKNSSIKKIFEDRLEKLS